MSLAPPGLTRRIGARAGALPWRLRGSSPAGMDIAAAGERVVRLLRDALATEAERRRLFLWLPVMMGLGILLYFGADREPALWAPLTGLAVSACAAWWLRLRRGLFCSFVCLAAIFAGFAAATWRTATIAAPILDRQRIGQLTGYVEQVEARDGGGARLVVLVTSLAGVPAEQRPVRVRINIRSGSAAPGDHISAAARLLPPPGPARPGGYDFGRDAFFKGIGAVGSISGKIALAPPPPGPAPDGLRLRIAIDQARNALTERIASVGGGQGGAMGAALVTGKRGLITEASNSDLRAAGIYHIVTSDMVFR